ncbi:MAG: hypothetical protein ACAH83_14260 [Alphaproteobacteria bacterium]
MKESDISKRFEEVIDEVRNAGGNYFLRQHLRGIRDAVSSLQEAGMDAALTVRPGEYESPIARDKDANTLANGTACLDGLKIDFVIETTASDTCRLRAYMGKHHVAFAYLRQETDMKTVFTNALLKTKAQFQLMEEFNVEAGGNISTGKDIPVSPPLKLKQKPDLSL